MPFPSRGIDVDGTSILLLGMNGYGFGAQKILRGMYERAVTAAFLHRHPDQVDAFLDFGHINDWKLLTPCTRHTEERGFCVARPVLQRRKSCVRSGSYQPTSSREAK